MDSRSTSLLDNNPWTNLLTIRECPKWQVQAGGDCGGQNRADLSFCVFSCFVVFGGPQLPRCWEKTARTVSLSRPSLCASNAGKNEELRAVSPYAGRQSTGNMTNRPQMRQRNSKMGTHVAQWKTAPTCVCVSLWFPLNGQIGIRYKHSVLTHYE